MKWRPGESYDHERSSDDRNEQPNALRDLLARYYLDLGYSVQQFETAVITTILHLLRTATLSLTRTRLHG